MADNRPTSNEWRRLFEAAVRIKEIAPWQWMTETDVFAVQNPESNLLGFVSVMGMLGEHFAVSVYLGSDGLYKFLAFEDTGHLTDPEGLLEIPQLQVSFENRNELHDRDRKIIKELGLKFRGQHAWPMFRSYRPGFAPWFLEAEEARFLAVALNQLADIAPRVKENPTFLEIPNDEGYLVCVLRQEENSFIWENRPMKVPPPEPSRIQIYLETQTLDYLKHLPLSNLVLGIDLFIFPSAIQERDARPYFPYMLLMVDNQSGMIVGTDMLKPDPSLETMWGLIPQKVAQKFARTGIVPKEVLARSEIVAQLLKPLAVNIGFKLKQSDEMPSIDEVKEFLFQRFM